MDPRATRDRTGPAATQGCRGNGALGELKVCLRREVTAVCLLGFPHPVPDCHTDPDGRAVVFMTQKSVRETGKEEEPVMMSLSCRLPPTGDAGPIGMKGAKGEGSVGPPGEMGPAGKHAPPPFSCDGYKLTTATTNRERRVSVRSL